MTDSNETAIVSIATVLNSQPGTSICSIEPKPGDIETAKVVYNAMTNPTHKLSNFINKRIKVENYLIEISEVLDEESGELVTAPRIVLIAPDGTSYAAISKGLFNSVRNAVMALGDAPWQGGIEFEVQQIQVGRGKMLTLAMV